MIHTVSSIDLMNIICSVIEVVCICITKLGPWLKNITEFYKSRLEMT